MPENAYASQSSDGRPRSPEAFSLEAYIDRELRTMQAEGRTMAKWLAEIDALRSQGMLPDIHIDDIVAGIHAARAEREARMEEW